MTKKKKNAWEKKLDEERRAFKPAKSYKQWTDRQREKHEENPGIADAAFYAAIAAEQRRLIAGRHRQIEQRQKDVAERIKGAPMLPDWLDEMLTECREEFTPREVEALVYRYGYELSLQEAADALGLSNRETFRRRLERAEAKVAHLNADVVQELLAEAESDRHFAEEAERARLADLEVEKRVAEMEERQRLAEAEVERLAAAEAAERRREMLRQLGML